MTLSEPETCYCQMTTTFYKTEEEYIAFTNVLCSQTPHALAEYFYNKHKDDYMTIHHPYVWVDRSKEGRITHYKGKIHPYIYYPISNFFHEEYKRYQWHHNYNIDADHQKLLDKLRKNTQNTTQINKIISELFNMYLIVSSHPPDWIVKKHKTDDTFRDH